MILLFLVSVIIGCKSDDAPVSSSLPESRSFYMGFTAFPYDLSLAAVDETFAKVTANGDVLLAHFDFGVPWDEALNNLPFPNEVQNTIDQIVREVPSSDKIVLTATATSQERDALANYWNDAGTHQQLGSPWDTYSFDSPEVIAAYLNYCRRIIDAIQPDYFGYGIEINPNFQEGSDALDAYLKLAQTIYPTLKQEYPNLPIFLSFQDQSFEKDKEALLEFTKQFLPYTDIMAVSTYPFWLVDQPTQDANPDLLDDDWLIEMRNLAPNKPFAISETGYSADDLVLDPLGVNIKSDPTWQANYVQLLCERANRLNAEFVLWFVYRDYDLLYEATTDPPIIFKIWRDNGLLDGDGNRRPSHLIWDNWLNSSLK